MRNETPQDIVARQNERHSRTLRIPLYAFLTAGAGVALVAAGQALASDVIESAGAVLALGGIVVCAGGVAWSIIVLVADVVGFRSKRDGGANDA